MGTGQFPPDNYPPTNSPQDNSHWTITPHANYSSNIWGYLGRFGSKFPNF